MRVSLRDMQRIAVGIGRDDFSALARGVLGIRTPDAALDLGVAVQLQILVWEWLAHLGFVTDMQRRAVVGMPELARAAAALGAAGDRSAMSVYPVYRLGIAEYRYAFWGDSDRWFDVRHEEYLVELPEPPITTIACDVTALYLRAVDRLARLGAGQDAES